MDLVRPLLGSAAFASIFSAMETIFRISDNSSGDNDIRTSQVKGA
jgi:hypothetical protein